MKFQKTILLLALACALFTSATSELIASEPTESLFQLEYRDGTILTSMFAESKLMWTDVSEFGQMTKQPIDVASIISLTLTDEPASEQLATILKLMSQLDSDDFYIREEAELQLRKTGKRFRSMIAKYNALETPDGIYRLKRVLSSIRVSSKQSSGISLDVLTLDDGRKLTGDAGMNNLQFTINGKLLDVPRKRLAKISRANSNLVTRPTNRVFVETKLFHDHSRFMQGRDLKLIDFENRPDGTALSRMDKDVSSDFVDVGLILGTEYPMGCVGISGFEFKSGDKPVGDNSVCVYKSKIKKSNRFQGVLEITFCQPGKQNIPHGVKDFGMFLSKVNHSRDVLVEAYDSMDRLIGICESNDEVCTFCGISSSVPIAKIRATSNPWILPARRLMLDEMKRSGKYADLVKNPTFTNSYKLIDQDFAADSVMFSKPEPIDSVRDAKHFYGRNGDMVTANWVKVFDTDRIELSSRNVNLMTIKLPQANTIALKTVQKLPPIKQRMRGTWMAMLRDNSVLEWNPRALLKSTTLNQELSPDDVVAIWPSLKKPQLPLTGDFDVGAHVLVYPGCRVATSKVQLNKDGFRWSDSKVLQENLHEVNDQKFDQRDIKFDVPDRVAPSKTEYGFDTNDMATHETPTIWFEKPTSMLASQGALRLDNGEVIVYGPDSMTELVGMDRKQVTIKFRGKELAIPLSKIVAIVPPQE